MKIFNEYCHAGATTSWGNLGGLLIIAEKIQGQILGEAALYLTQSPGKKQKVVPCNCGRTLKFKYLKTFYAKSIKRYYTFNLIVKK